MFKYHVIRRLAYCHQPGTNPYSVRNRVHWEISDGEAQKPCPAWESKPGSLTQESCLRPQDECRQYWFLRNPKWKNPKTLSNLGIAPKTSYSAVAVATTISRRQNRYIEKNITSYVTAHCWVPLALSIWQILLMLRVGSCQSWPLHLDVHYDRYWIELLILLGLPSSAVLMHVDSCRQFYYRK